MKAAVVGDRMSSSQSVLEEKISARVRQLCTRNSSDDDAIRAVREGLASEGVPLDATTVMATVLADLGRVTVTVIPGTGDGMFMEVCL